MIVAAVIWHILVLIFAQMKTLEAGAAMLVLCGFAQSLTMVCHTVILLSASDQRYRGRIMGVWSMVMSGANPLGNLLAGPAADRWGVSLVLRVMSLGCAASLISERRRSSSNGSVVSTRTEW